MSVILPAYNERDNLAELVPSIAGVLRGQGISYEILVVDDGSTDGTSELMRELVSAEVVSVRLRRNAGKSAALAAGLARVRGKFIVLMDADGQDDPSEMVRLVSALRADDRLDLVTGRRTVRHDRFVKRTTSRLFNRVTSVVTGVPGEDFNSGLKAMRRELATGLNLYGELHRYIPVLAHWRGFRTDEIEVEHHARLHGQTKFGRARFWRGFLDLITVKFLTTYDRRPFHLFGGAGVFIGLIGSILLAWMLAERLLGYQIGTRPALLAGVLFVLVGVQLVVLGLLAELSVHLLRRIDPDAARVESSRDP